MADLRDRLQEAVDGITPKWSTAEDVRHESQRRRMRSRIAAGTVAVLVALAGVAVTLNALRSVDPSERPGAPEPLDVSGLDYAWTAEMSIADPLLADIRSPIAADGTSVFVLDDRGLTAYPKGCTDPCAPLWHAALEGKGGRDANEMAVGEGVVFVSGERSLAAFDADCQVEGQRCTPIWTAGLPPGAERFVGLQASGRTAMLMYSLGGSENRRGVNAAIFSADACDATAPCDPVATVELGAGTTYHPGAVIDGTFYQHVGTTLTGISPEPCGAAVCEPSFVLSASEDELSEAGWLLDPVGLGDEIVLVLGGEIRAYPRACHPSCVPNWIGDAGGLVEGQTPVVSGGTVAIVAGDRVLAFEGACATDGSACRPAWTGQLEDRGVLSGDESGIVARSFRGGRITAFGPGCSGECVPSWSIDQAGSTAVWEIAAGHAFIEVDGRLGAYPIDCEGPCEPVWSDRTDDLVREVIVDGTGVYLQLDGPEPKVVAYRPGGADDAPPRPETTETSEPSVEPTASDTASTPVVNIAPDDRIANVTVKGIGVASRLDWTLVQLDDPKPGGAGPILQLTNFHVSLTEPVCPDELQVPPGGVGLFVARTGGVDPNSVPTWPVEPLITETSAGACSDALPIAWSAGDATFAGMLFASPDASPADRDRLIEAFRRLTFDRFSKGSAPDLSSVDEMFEGPIYVSGLPPNAFDAEHVVLVLDDGDPSTAQLGSTSLGGIGYSTLEPEPGELFFQGGDAGIPIEGREGEYEVKAISYVHPSVDRVVLAANDGRQIDTALGPSLERYGVDLRLVYVEFRAPLVGDWMVYRDGEVVATQRYANWPPS